jgi:hypothetical protein
MESKASLCHLPIRMYQSIAKLYLGKHCYNRVRTAEFDRTSKESAANTCMLHYVQLSPDLQNPTMTYEYI